MGLSYLVVWLSNLQLLSDRAEYFKLYIYMNNKKKLRGVFYISWFNEADLSLLFALLVPQNLTSKIICTMFDYL